MASVFWDSHGVIFIDFLTEQRPINADYYLKLLKVQSKANSPFKTRTISQKVSFSSTTTRIRKPPL
jgi:hypothetical protein